MKFVSISIAAALLLTACVSEAEAPIRGTEWRVESLGPSTEPFADGKATVAFDEKGHISAFAGCNRMGGAYTLKGKVLQISKLMSTMMACVPRQKLIDEHALAESLAIVTTVEVKQDKATLSGPDGVVLTLWKVK